MRIRLYIDETRNDHEVVKEMLDRQQETDISSLVRIRDMFFWRDEEGTYTELKDFLGGMPSRLKSLPVCMATLFEEGYDNHPQEGYYVLDTAEAMVRSFFVRQDRMMGENLHHTWEIRAKADSFDDVVKIFRKIRSAQLDPIEPWIRKQ